MDEEYFQQLDEGDIERVEEANEDDAPVGPDEAEEVPTRAVKPKKIVIKPRLKLDDRRLKGPRGLCLLEPMFKEVKLRGAGYESRDLDSIMSLLEHWAHRLFPKMTFDDCLEKIQELGHKKTISSYVTLMRMGCGDAVSEDNDIVAPPRSPSPEPAVITQSDPFDRLLQQSLQTQLTEEQRERMERNKLLAVERRMARLKAKYERANAAENAVQDRSTGDDSVENRNGDEIVEPTSHDDPVISQETPRDIDIVNEMEITENNSV